MDRLSELQINEDSPSLWPKAHLRDLRQRLTIKSLWNPCCADFTTPKLPPWGLWSCWKEQQSGGRAVYRAPLPAFTNKLRASKSPSHRRQMDFDMEMASAQIDHLCIWIISLVCGVSATHGEHTVTILLYHIKVTVSCNSGSSDSLETLLTLCSPAVHLRSALNVALWQLCMFVAPNVSNYLDNVDFITQKSCNKFILLCLTTKETRGCNCQPFAFHSGSNSLLSVGG